MGLASDQSLDKGLAMYQAHDQMIDEGNGFTLYGNSRMYFASRPTDGFEADAYWQVIILDF